MVEEASADFILEDPGGAVHHPLQEFWTGKPRKDRRLHVQAAEANDKSAGSSGFGVTRVDMYAFNGRTNRSLHPEATTGASDHGSKGNVFVAQYRACK